MESSIIYNLAGMNNFSNLPFEKQYSIALHNLLEHGTISKDRTGVGTKRIQSQKITIDNNREFPILQGKKMNFQSAFVEMIWIMLGRTDLAFLKENGVNYWDSWVGEDGTFGPIYGKQMRNFGGVDQLKDVINQLRYTPDSRRIMISLWNPIDLKLQKLPPCHFIYQFSSYVNSDNIRVMDLHVMQRSADSFLGVPYDFMLFSDFGNLVSYLTEIPLNKIHCTFNDFHMYLNHEEQVKKYLDNYDNDKQNIISNYVKGLYINTDTENTDKKIKLKINEELIFPNEFVSSRRELDVDYLLDSIVNTDFKFLELLNYENNHYPFIKAEVAV